MMSPIFGGRGDRSVVQRTIFILILIASATPWCGPVMALTAGILFSLVLGNPWKKQTAAWSKRALQWSVFGLGFGVSLVAIWQTGRDAVLYTPASIALTVAVGLLLGRLLVTPPRVATLIAFGTAICGGSAIAAMAPVIQADDEEIAVALATVFSLNAAALLLFPPIGHLLGLTERQFGLWAALAIHDTSSVVGAAAAYGGAALAVGTTVKLARAIWIAPSALLAARLSGRRQVKARIPLFIIGFIAAAGVRALLPDLSSLWQLLAAIARQGLVVTLFLVGTGLTREVLQRVGVRPLLLGVILWVLVSAAVLAAVSTGVLS
jgi:uncharacterized integral membrane protein (TIGR00698 family)